MDLPPPDADLAGRRRAMLILFGITGAAAAVRFAFLGQPCLWGDEALVYWRTCGTYAELLRPLRGDGFPPLHYELYWLIVHALGHTPGPAAMRAAPAACGTLLVPAVYGLARQVLPRRPALTAAAVTAANAFALFYSRDAKMYAEAWLAMTVSVACLMAWLRTGRSTAWLGWVAAGAAAGGLQTLTLISVAGLSPLLLLTQRRAHWRQLPAWLGGVALIAAGPVGYYARFNGWAAAVDQKGWQQSGLAWVASYNHDRSGPQQVGFLTTAFLTGWEWPRPAAFAHMPADRAWLLCGAATAVVACVAAGLLPWPRRWQAVDADRAPEPPWRATLWLAAWVVLPLYAFHCRSMADFDRPFDPLGVHPRAWIVAAAVTAAGWIAAGLHRPTRAIALRWASLAVVLGGVAVGCQLIGTGMATAARAAAAAGRPWASVWVPRYLGFVWPAVAVVTGAALARLPTASVRASALGLVLAVNLGMFAFRLFGPTEPPVDRMAADVWAAQPPPGRSADTLVWARLSDHSYSQVPPGSGNLFSDPGRYYLQRLADRPMSPARFKASLSTFKVRRDDPATADLTAIKPAVRRLIIWEESDRPDGFAPDADLPGWHRSAEQTYAVHDVWTAQDVAQYRRRQYDRP